MAGRYPPLCWWHRRVAKLKQLYVNLISRLIQPLLAPSTWFIKLLAVTDWATLGRSIGKNAGKGKKGQDNAKVSIKCLA